MQAIRNTFILGFAAIFIAACTSKINVTPTFTVHSTQPQILRTATPAPSETPRPTLIITATPTIDKITALASEFNIPAVCLFSYRVSNDRTWIGADCPLYRELIIANRSAENKIILPYQEIEKEASTYFSTRPLSWSSDNQYFYFTSSCCEPYETANQNGSLYRFDTEKESWSVFIRAVYDPYYFFSENGDRLVYINHYPFENTISVVQYIEIGMLEMSSNKSKRIVLTGYYAPTQPSYAWSKNNDEFTLILDHPILSEMRTEEVMLKIDFEKMGMWFVE